MQSAASPKQTTRMNDVSVSAIVEFTDEYSQQKVITADDLQ